MNEINAGGGSGDKSYIGINQYSMKEKIEYIKTNAKNVYMNYSEICGIVDAFNSGDDFVSSSASNFKTKVTQLINDNFEVSFCNLLRYSQVLELVLGEFIKTDREILDEYESQMGDVASDFGAAANEETTTPTADPKEPDKPRTPGGGDDDGFGYTPIGSSSQGTPIIEEESELDWPNNKFTKLFPKPKFGKNGKINWLTDDSFSYTITGVSNENYNEYLKLLPKYNHTFDKEKNFWTNGNYKTFITYENNELTISTFESNVKTV